MRKSGPKPRDVASFMSDTLAQAHDPLQPPDRRLYRRQPIRSLAYVELDEGNGGIVLNISEGGLSVQAVTSLMDDLLPGVRFQLSESDGWVEANARITWTDQSRKVAGLEFADLAEDSRNRIRKWIVRESLSAEEVIQAEAASPEKLPSGVDSDSGETTTLPSLVAATVFIAEDSSGRRQHDATSLLVNGMVTPTLPLPVSASVSPVEVFGSNSGPRLESEPVRVGQLATAANPPPASLFGNKLALGALLAVFAIGSLAAGWAAAQGDLGKFFGRIRNATPQNFSAGRDAMPSSASPIAHVAGIEVVDASNQRWMIPFDGPLGPSEPGVRRQTSGGTVSPPNRPQTGFRTWILAAPRLTRAASDSGEPPSAGPPAVANTPSASESVLSSSGSANSPSLTGPVNLRKPDPPPLTGVVKPAELLHQVNPEYPKFARAQRVEGTVRLNVTIGEDGVVRGVAILGGPLLLTRAAEDAVRQWRYSPTLLDGKPIAVQKEVDLRFHFSDAPQ